MRRIVYTRHDGGVTVCTPAPQCLADMARGGHWGPIARGFLDDQIDRQVANGIAPDAAARFVRALAFGGATEAEAYAIIRDRDCGHLGSGHELWDTDELPDRWFRDAWRRSSNGGPIRLDLDTARGMQWRRMRAAVAHRTAELTADWRRAGDGVRVDWGAMSGRLAAADDERAIRAVWPVWGD